MSDPDDKRRRGFWAPGRQPDLRYVMKAVAAFVVLPVLFLFTALPGRHPRNAKLTEAVSNLRQVGLAMFEFQAEYDGFPDASIIPKISKSPAPGNTWKFGTKSSNDYFRQLIASGIGQSEVMFYCKAVGTVKPDNIMTDARSLEKGDCGYTYFLGARDGDRTSRPLVVAPMIPGTDRFDPRPFQGKAVILKMDNSVISVAIQKDGRVVLDGRNLMDPHHPVWDGHAPVIAWPDL